MEPVLISDLEGPALDWVVAKLLPESSGIQGIRIERTHCGDPYIKAISPTGNEFSFCPSSSAEDAFAIINREEIQWAKNDGQIEAWSGFDYFSWRDKRNESQLPDGSGYCTGSNILEAAMRCFVTSRKKEAWVEVPSELVPKEITIESQRG
jgi:hypothetical protein